MLRWLYRWRVHRWVGRPRLPAAALEIGCGPGWMLQALRERGWQVAGTERTIGSAHFAAAVKGLPIFVGGLDALRPTPHFDVIILFHVLEHLADPLDTLRDCAALLKADGRLILSVPNFHSWQARLFGPRWFHLDVPRHQYHFEPRSLAETLRRAGFEAVDVSFVSFEHDPYGWIQSLLNAWGFEPNLLTRLLMGQGSGRSSAGVVAIMVAVSAALVVPSLLLSLCSWLTRSGAIMEVRAMKTERGRMAFG
jgi:SAM-dependent methyltransferase